MLYLNRTAAIFAIILTTCHFSAADDAAPEQQLTLMGMLSEWMYPESKFEGANSSDAAVTNIQSIKSKAALTTPDSMDQVMEFYRKKLGVDNNGKNLDEKDKERVTTDRSVLIQDISGDQPNSLYLIAINEKKSSTTLVISRPANSQTTRIGWSNFRQFAE